MSKLKKVNIPGIPRMENGIWVKDKFITNEQLEMIVELHSKGATEGKTSEEVGVSVNRIRYIFTKLNKDDLNTSKTKNVQTPQNQLMRNCPECPSDVEAAYWNNCFGTYTDADGSKYVGEWKDGKRHGQGTYTWADGNKNVGEWKDDKRHGQGTFTSTDGEKYVGEFKDDKLHGQGIHTYADGSEYVGEFKDNKSHGQGIYTYADGRKYDGEWRNDKPHGQGIYTDADGMEILKICPECGEEVKQAARKCKHCGEDLTLLVNMIDFGSGGREVVKGVSTLFNIIWKTFLVILTSLFFMYACTMSMLDQPLF